MPLENDEEETCMGKPQFITVFRDDTDAIERTEDEFDAIHSTRSEFKLPLAESCDLAITHSLRHLEHHTCVPQGKRISESNTRPPTRATVWRFLPTACVV